MPRRRKSVFSRLLRSLLLVFLVVVVLVGAAWLWLTWRDEVIYIRPRMGDSRGAEPLRVEGRDAAIATLTPGATVPDVTVPDVTVPDVTVPAEMVPVKPKNVVLVIADGMGFSQVAAARAQLAGLEGRLYFERLPFVGWQMTWSLNRLVPDSASSATAMATGFKVENGALSLSADETVLPTVLEGARDRGLRTGLVTDSYLWDATPAAFATHVASRRDRDAILAQLAASGVDFLVGGRGDIDRDSTDGERLSKLFTEAGYHLAWDWDDLSLHTVEGKLIGLLPEGSIADLDRPPRLSHVAELALNRLSRPEAGFFLMVETEETDTASHRKELRRLLDGIGELEETVRTVVEILGDDGETLILVTSDHETGGLAVISGDRDRPVGVAWATRGHSAEPVPIYAYGPGAERFAGVLDNTDVARILADLLELDLFNVDP